MIMLRLINDFRDCMLDNLVWTKYCFVSSYLCLDHIRIRSKQKSFIITKITETETARLKHTKTFCPLSNDGNLLHHLFVDFLSVIVKRD